MHTANPVHDDPRQPPFWNPWARYRAWSKANPAQAQIAAIMAGDRADRAHVPDHNRYHHSS